MNNTLKFPIYAVLAWIQECAKCAILRLFFLGWNFVCAFLMSVTMAMMMKTKTVSKIMMPISRWEWSEVWNISVAAPLRRLPEFQCHGDHIWTLSLFCLFSKIYIKIVLMIIIFVRMTMFMVIFLLLVTSGSRQVPSDWWATLASVVWWSGKCRCRYWCVGKCRYGHVASVV